LTWLDIVEGGYCQSGIRMDPEAEQHYGGILVVNRKAGQRDQTSATIAEANARINLCLIQFATVGFSRCSLGFIQTFLDVDHGECVGPVNAVLRVPGRDGIWNIDRVSHSSSRLCVDAADAEIGTRQASTRGRARLLIQLRTRHITDSAAVVAA
jgi:hypothetical protein